MLHVFIYYSIEPIYYTKFFGKEKYDTGFTLSYNGIMSSFFSMIFRMKYITRWGLMNNKRSENLSEHSLEVGMIAHCLATIGNKRLGKQLDADHIAVMGMFHDCTEIITGDMPTPVKYFNEEIRRTYKGIERTAAKELVKLLPDDMKDVYEPLLNEQGNCEYETRLVKAADKICAYIKCIDEIRMGNDEFNKARTSAAAAIAALDLDEANIFMEEFAPSYALTLDEQKLADLL